jgi:hypothetical protein
MWGALTATHRRVVELVDEGNRRRERQSIAGDVRAELLAWYDARQG